MVYKPHVTCLSGSPISAQIPNTTRHNSRVRHTPVGMMYLKHSMMEYIFIPNQFIVSQYLEYSG